MARWPNRSRTHAALAAVSALVPSLTSIAAARAANANDAEPVRLVFTAPPACASETAFRAYIASAGGELRPERPGVAARTLTARVTGDGPFAGELVVSDIFGEETTRAVSGDSCDEVARTLALFVALALDTPPRERAPEDPPPSMRDAPPPPLPATTTEGASGDGIALIAFVGSGGGRWMTGLEGLVSARFGAAHLGGLLGFQGDRIDTTHDTTVDYMIASGQSGRMGAFAAWGAPWDDDVLGFMIEAGIAGGSARGGEGQGKRSDDGWQTCNDLGCASTALHPVRARFVSPYAGASLFAQWPFNRAVRPFVGLTALWTPGIYEGSPVTVALEIGGAWLAW